MPAPHAPAPTPGLEAGLAWGLDHPVSHEARSLAEFLARAFGPGTVGVIHYGSRAQGRQPRADSAFDFFVIVDQYRPAYESLRAMVGTSYSARMATALARVLAPNVISVIRREDGEVQAKCCVISRRDFQRACSPRRRDHFVQGRLFQFVVVAWARDEDATQAMRHAVVEARIRTFGWGRPSLPDRFTVDGYTQALLARSLMGEIRPEAGNHATTLVAAQQESLRAIYAPLLEALAEEGRLSRAGDGITYHLQTPPGWFERKRLAWYFQRSKFRATVRLLKSVILYEGWLDYLLRKIERSGDATIVLTAREQRWPLIFLWPRVFRYLRNRPQRRRDRDSE
jgi:hypothetical protein